MLKISAISGRFLKWDVQRIGWKLESGLLNLFHDANFSVFNFMFLRWNVYAASKNILTVRKYTLGIPERESTSTEKLSRGLTSKKTEFRRKFYRCKYSFWFRPSPARITYSTSSIRNNWPSADPPAGRHLADNWIPNSSLELSYIFPRDAVEILYAPVSQDDITERYGNSRACYVQSRELSHSLTHVSLVCMRRILLNKYRKTYGHSCRKTEQKVYGDIRVQNCNFDFEGLT